ncbi:MAG: MFS transporter [Notoacmeibacter sp.]
MTPYVRFVTAAGFTNLADGVATVAWAWLATLLTRDPLFVAMVPVALRLPWFLFAIPAGLVTDRVNRRSLIIAMDCARALAFALAALSVWMALPLAPAPAIGVSSVALFSAIVVAALLVGLAEVFRDNAAQTMLPSFVPHDKLEGANARMWTVESIMNNLMGPVVGAFLIGLFLPIPFVLNAVCFVVAAFLVSMIQGQFQPPKRETPNLRAEFKEAFDFLISKPLLRTLAWTTGFWNMFHQMTLVAMVLYAQETLGLSAAQYGFLLTAGAIGGIFGSLIAERVIKWIGAPLAAPIMLSVSIIEFSIVALIPNVYIVAFGLFLGGCTAMIWDTISVSNRQRLIPDQMLGRVNSMYRLMAWGLMPVGLALSGLIVRFAEGPLARETALVLPFYVAAIGTAILTTLSWRGIRNGLAELLK